MKKLLITVCMMIFLLGATAGGLAAQDVVKIGHLRIVMSLPTYVAQEKGFFEQAGIKAELIPFDSGTAIMDALMAGRIDIVGCSSTTAFWFPAQSAPDRFKMFLLYGTKSRKEDNSFSVVVKKDSPIQDIKGLKGKKVGTYPGATSVALAKAVVRTQTDVTKVIFTELPPPNLISALAADQIDAFFAPEPSGMIAVSQGVGRYLVKSPLTLLKKLDKGVPGAAFAFSANFLQKNPDQAKQLKAIFEKAVDYIRTNEKEARPYLAKYTGLPDAVAMSIPFDHFIKLSEFDKQAGQDYFDLLYKEGAYQVRVDTMKLYYEK